MPLIRADAESCCKAFLHNWLAFFSLPSRADSDNGNTFTAQLWKGLQNHLGIKVEFTPRFRPQANGAVERQHQALKNSLRATLIDMGDKHREKWHDALPWVLMGRRTAFQEDLKCSPYQLTFGQSPVLPGAIVDDPGPSLGTSQVQELLHGLEAQMDTPAIQMSHHNKPSKPFIKDINAATHVYLKVDNPQGLQQKYHGPFEINKRLGESTIEVRTGTFKNGEPRLEIHSWHNAKPAYMSRNAVTAERPKLGRPAKIDIANPEPVSVIPSPPDPVPLIPTQPLPARAQEILKRSKPVSKPAAPSTHNMTLRSR